jgi:hypothetical protein
MRSPMGIQTPAATSKWRRPLVPIGVILVTVAILVIAYLVASGSGGGGY